jgi:4-hydroxy-3-polyprenylbenzoate decarboxylase
MPWRDFREFIDEAERAGDVCAVPEADCNIEIGALTELMCEQKGPMLLFDHINGYPAGYRIAAKPYSTPRRAAIALGLPRDGSPLDMLRAWRVKLRDYQPIKPRTVASGAVLENVMEGEDVNLMRFPTPLWHEADGGPYFGTGCGIVTVDPDEQWVNIGSYRAMLHDERTLGIDIAPYNHGNLHMKKWWERGMSCPLAVIVSPDPYLFCASAHRLPWGTAEYDYAGFVRGEPGDVFIGEHTGLPLPANAEIIVEGEVPPPSEELRSEGPFGEFTGYYAGGTKTRPVIRVKAIYHRTDPIIHGEPPLKPPIGQWGISLAARGTWDAIEKAGVPGIKGVYPLPVGGNQILVVSITQQYAGHARQVGRIASSVIGGFGRVTVVVDDDIDPSNSEDVLWAIASRTDPATSFEFQPGCPSSSLDPMIPPERKQRGEYTASRVLIDACRPWQWKDQFPAVNRSSDELRVRTRAKWRHLLEK